MKKYLFSALFLLATAANASEYCLQVLDRGLREYSIRTSSTTYLNSIHSRYCDSSSNLRSGSENFGLEAVVKQLPVKLTGGSSSATEAIRNFCKSYQSSTTDLNDDYLYQEKIIQRAYDSFEQCLLIANTGVTLTHTVRSLKNMDFYLAAGLARPVTLNGISSTDNVSCTGIVNGELETFNPETVVVVDGNTSLNISCVRTPVADGNGGELFEEATVTLLTNVGKNGNYGAFWPADTRMPIREASIIKTQIEKLQSENDDQNKTLNTQQVRVDGIGSSNATGTPVKLHGRMPVGGTWSDEAGMNWLSCPEGQYVAGVGGLDTDGGKFCSTCISRVGVICKPLHKP